jgi:hypothetical protein
VEEAVISLPDDFADCIGDSEAARWLLRCSPSRLLRDESHIRRWLRLSGFRAGIDYLDAELLFLRSARADDGGPSELITITVARGRMDRIACGLPPRNLGA